MKKRGYKGFTLIELLVVMAIISLFGGIVVSVLFSLFRGSNKANTLITLRQTGQYAMDQVSRTIRDAKTLVIPTTTGCQPPNNIYTSIEFTTLDDQQNFLNTVLACTSDNQLTISTMDAAGATNTKTLVDNQSANATCSFTCSIDSASQIPIITFDLIISQKDSNSSPEKSGSLNYNTSILMRNYDR